MTSTKSKATWTAGLALAIATMAAALALPARAGTIENLERERAILIDMFLDPEMTPAERQTRIGTSTHRLLDLERIFAATDGIDPVQANFIERALARHLRDAIPRVIASIERRERVRNLAVDLSDKRDRRSFARATSCDSHLVWRVLDTDSHYVLFWSQRTMGLEVKLVRTDDDLTLWKARHIASRSNGGLPLSLLSAPMSAYQATSLAGDADVVPSMVEDVVRRLFTTLPSPG